MNFFFAPVSSDLPFQNYQKTVVGGVKEEKFHSHNIAVDSRFVNDRAYLWGLKASARSRWLQLENGDIILFYHKGSIVSYSVVIDKFEHKELSDDLWGYFKNKNIPKFYWSLIIVLSQSHSCKIPFAVFKEILGFSQNYTLKSFFKLKDSFGDFLQEEGLSFEEFVAKHSINET